MSASPLIVASSASWAELVARLPAEDRAQIAWAPKRIADLTAALLTDPSLTEATIEKAADEYLEASTALAQSIVSLARSSDFSARLKSGMERDLRALQSLPPSAAKAALRASLTLTLVAQIGVAAIGKLDLSTLKHSVESLKSSDPRDLLPMRAAALVLAVLEGIRKGSPIPGRVSALARRADAVAQDFSRSLAAGQPPLRLPWYDETAEGAATVKPFASWNPESETSQPMNVVPEDALKVWEQVKEGVESARPHRKVFA